MSEENVINHCGRNIPHEEEFNIEDYPQTGDWTRVKRTKCLECNCKAYAYQMVYAGNEQPTEWYQAIQKRIKHGFEQAISEGRALWIQKKNAGGNKPTKFGQHASEYSLTVNGRAENVLHYLKKLDRAYETTGGRDVAPVAV